MKYIIALAFFGAVVCGQPLERQTRDVNQLYQEPFQTVGRGYSYLPPGPSDPTPPSFIPNNPFVPNNPSFPPQGPPQGPPRGGPPSGGRFNPQGPRNPFASETQVVQRKDFGGAAPVLRSTKSRYCAGCNEDRV